jgi:two-component system chemotaxis response regulator CheB
MTTEPESLAMPDSLDDSLPFYVAMGASGPKGLADLRALLALMPGDIAAIVLVVLHRPPDKISHLREILARSTDLPVVIATDNGVFTAGTCYIGTPSDHLALASNSRVRLIDGAANQYCNRTVDLLFTSLAMHANKQALGVVLSGSLSDGSQGLAAIHHAGGATLVLGYQQQADQGMPQNATEYDGPIDFIGPIDEIAGEILSRLRSTARHAVAP